MADSLGDSLDRALEGAFTRPRRNLATPLTTAPTPAVTTSLITGGGNGMDGPHPGSTGPMPPSVSAG